MFIEVQNDVKFMGASGRFVEIQVSFNGVAGCYRVYYAGALRFDP